MLAQPYGAPFLFAENIRECQREKRVEMEERCPKQHVIRSSADRVNGYCRQCKRIYDREYRRRQKMKVQAANDVVAIFAAAGAVFKDGAREVSAQELAAQLVKVYGHTLD